MTNRRLQILPSTLLLALLYFVTGRLGLMLPAYNSNITLVWLPSGIAVAALLRCSVRCWPGVALGAFAVDLAVGGSWLSALGMALGNTLGPLLTVWILRRIGFRTAFDRQRDILLLAAGAALGMLASVGLGVPTLALTGGLPSGWLFAGLTWWAGDVTGVIAAAPLLLAFTRPEWRAIGLRRVEFLIWACATGLIVFGVFIFNPGPKGHALALAFLPLPLVAWAALRFGAIGTSLAIIVLSVGAAYATAHGRGPFHLPDRMEEVMVLWLFMATSAVLGWMITALHAARNEATRIQSLFEQALNDVSLGVLLANLDRKITYANAGFTHLTGYAEAELLGRNCRLLQGPETDPVVLEQLRMALNGDQGFDGEILNYRKDGTTFWNGLLISPVRNERGKLTGFLAIQRDITQRRIAEEALRRSELQFRTLADNLPDVVARFDRNLRHLYINPQAESATGLKPEAFIGRTNEELGMPTQTTRLWKATLETVFSNGADARIEFSFPGPAGERLWESHVVAEREPHGTIQTALVLSRDITGLRQAEVALQEALNRLQKIASQVPGVIYQYRLRPDGSSCFPYASEAIRDIYRVSPEDVREDASRLFGILHPEDLDAVLASIQESASNLTPWRHEYRVKFGDGTVRWLYGNALPQRESDGSALWHGFITDITERKQSEAARASLEVQLRESQKMEAIGTLAGGVAHDFNNALATILGNVELARQDMSSNPLVMESLEEIRTAGSRARDLVKQILSFSRRRPTELRPTSLPPLIGESVRLLRATLPARLTIEVHCDVDVPPVLADATQIEQIVINLATNAMQAMRSGPGQIGLRLDTVMLDAALVEARPALRGMYARRPGRTVRLAVSDDGPGMDAVILGRIFEPFFTTKPVGEGTGLGLSVVHGIVQAHGGAITVESQPGRGATFTVYLAVAKASANVSEPKENDVAGTAMPSTGGGQHILYLDDDESLVFLVRRLLVRRGYRISGYTEQQAALEALRVDPAGFDLVVTDYNMPGLSGLEVARAVRAIRADLPVAVTSGFVDEELRAQASGAGVRELIFKASTVEDLCGVVQRLAQRVADKTKSS